MIDFLFYTLALIEIDCLSFIFPVNHIDQIRCISGEREFFFLKEEEGRAISSLAYAMKKYSAEASDEAAALFAKEF